MRIACNYCPSESSTCLNIHFEVNMLLYKVYILHYLYLMSEASVMIVENELVSNYPYDGIRYCGF